MITRTQLGAMGAKVALATALVAAPVLGAATANAAPAPVAAASTASTAIAPTATTFQAADWWYWHCRVQHEWWRPRCHGWAPPPPYYPPPPTGSI